MPRQVSNVNDFGQLALIAFGSNDNSVWGDQKETVQKAMAEVANLAQTPARYSKLYQTPAYPAGSGPDFVNAAIAIDTKLSAQALLDQMHKIEAAAGRTRRQRWEQRTLDLDLIALGDQILPDLPTYMHWHDLAPEAQQTEAPTRLILPHPRLQDRPFVLIPLADVAPDWRHPVHSKTIADLLTAISSEDLESIVPLV